MRVLEGEREEFEAILRSKTLSSAPSVLRLAGYIGEKYFKGEADQLKEYNIAVDVLGKPPDFDSKLDSIVRVEAHRLRKKLKRYYQTEGSTSNLELILNPGQYVPMFVPRQATEVAEAQATLEPALIVEEPDVPASKADEQPRRHRVPLLVAVPGLVILLSGLAYFLFWNLESTSQPVLMLTAPGGPFIDGAGRAWTSEEGFRGGSLSQSRFAAINGDNMPQSRREGDFDYDIPLRRGIYELRLHFVRAAGEDRSTHGFRLSANGRMLMDDRDAWSEIAFTQRLVTRVFRGIHPAADGKLHLAFRSGRDKAFVNAIELTPGKAGALVPIRVLTKSAPFKSPDGTLWGVDRYVEGGRLVARTEPVKSRFDVNLFTSERYGNFRYRIPVTPGNYKVTLFMAETWFGPNRIGKGGDGSRRFDVRINGREVLRDFDLFAAAGGSYIGIARSFAHQPVGPDGYLDLEFVPRVNNACINAIEIEEEGG